MPALGRIVECLMKTSVVCVNRLFNPVDKMVTKLFSLVLACENAWNFVWYEFGSLLNRRWLWKIIVH